MLDQVRTERVAAYDEAAAHGHVIYGRRGPRGALSAVRAAASALGLATSTPIVAALKAADHDHVRMAEARRARRRPAARQAEAEARRLADQVCGGSEASYLGLLAGSGTIARGKARAVAVGRAERRQHSRTAAKRARQDDEIDAAVQRLAREARKVTAQRGAADAPLALDRLRRQPTGHALALMFSRGQIETRQFLVACKFRALFEIAQASPVSAVDFTRDVVDGGRASNFDLIAGGVIEGKDECAAVLRRVGEAGYTFLVLVAVHGMGLLDAAKAAGFAISARERDARAYASNRLRDALDDAARVIGG